MRLRTYRTEAGPRTAIVDADGTFDAGIDGSLLAAIGAEPARGAPVDAPPVAPFRPRKNVVRAHGNYRLDDNHKRLFRRGRPFLSYYGKAPSAVNDPGAPISWPRELAEQVCAEPQLAVIVGRTMRYVAPEDALAHVFGYAACTDVSAEDLKRKHEQWAYGVSLDTFFCWGPDVVTADEVPDPDALTLTLEVNGAAAIEASTADHVLSTAQVLSELSHGITLEPGDVVLTGVPTIAGLGSVPERWLVDGDVVRTVIGGVGELTNEVATR